MCIAFLMYCCKVVVYMLLVISEHYRLMHFEQGVRESYQIHEHNLYTNRVLEARHAPENISLYDG